jgi:hypothetical protein
MTPETRRALSDAYDTTTYGVRNLWTKKDIGTTAAALTADVPGHDVLMLRLHKM